MDEKTDRLRELFMDISGEKTVTETREESRGSLAGDEEPPEERLAAVIEGLHDRFGREPVLAETALIPLVKGFYAGLADEELAADLEVDPATVFEARLSLHLVREEEPECFGLPDEVLSALRDPAGDLAEGPAGELDDDLGDDVAGWADRLPEATDVPRETLERARQVVAAESRARRVSYRFRTTFEEILTDADLSVRLTAETHRDGLSEATDGAEVDVDF